LLAAVVEAATGLALILRPSFVGRLLIGQHLSGAAVPVARVCGLALIGLAIACWPGPPLLGMATYSGLVALYLTYLGVAHGVTALLLWPAVVFHLALTALLVWAWRARSATRDV
jgi:hypothetical protein